MAQGSGLMSYDSIITYRIPRKKNLRFGRASITYILLINSEIVGQCWLWRGSVNLRGYGQFHATSVHICAYKEWKGEIPHGMTIDHICHNKLCINPDHLHITSRLNNRVIGGRKKLICMKGHPIKYPNLAMCYYKKGKYVCKKCQIESKMIHGYYYA